MIVTACNLDYPLPFEELNLFRMWQIIFVGVAELTFVFVLLPSSPRIDISILVDGHTMKITTCNIDDLLPEQPVNFII